jgi:hypothetical protein
MVRERGPDDPRRPIGNDQQQIAEPSGAQILEERAHGVDINKRRRPLSAAGGCGYCNRRGSQGSAMLRDESGNGGGRPKAPRNVLGDGLEDCSTKPMTGFFRDGCCNTSREDIGGHTVCAVITAEFLEFSKSCGNDLSTPMTEFGFSVCATK